MDIGTKTPAELIDALITNNIKCFLSQEKIMDESLPDAERFQASLLTHELNYRRNQLIRALDKVLGFSQFTQTEKSYSIQFEKAKNK